MRAGAVRGARARRAEAQEEGIAPVAKHGPKRKPQILVEYLDNSGGHQEFIGHVYYCRGGAMTVEAGGFLGGEPLSVSL